ncbi:MAG TPA: methyltransferase domain-containing protein [Thermoanaerobaculia bacterium]
MSDERRVGAPPSGLEGWREVWRENLEFPDPASGFKGAFLRLVRKLVGRATLAERDRQRNFNMALLELIEDERRQLAAATIELQREVAAARIELDSLLRLAVERNDALLSAVDRKAETALARVRDVVLPLLATSPRPEAAEEWLYRRLEEGLRGSESEVREALGPYVEYARRSAPVIDAGCGRGEFLELCRREGIEARGYETNARSVADLQARGLAAEVGAIPSCFTQLGEASVGSILVAHVVEHLPVGALLDLFAEARRVLRAGGFLMLETPNAEALAVSASDFWRDPTHLAPRHVAALTLLAREYGFAVEEVRAVHPFSPSRRLDVPESASAEMRALVARLNEILFAPQDLRLVLRKE